MIQSILVARMLGAEAFGILATIITFTSVVNKFASFRMGELVIKYVGHYTETGDQPRAAALFKAAALAEILASVVAFGLIWVLSPLGARYLAKDIHLASWFTVYGLIVLANLIAESSTGLLQIYDRFRRLAIVNVAQSAFSLVLIGLVSFTGGGLLEVLLAYIGGKMLGALTLTGVALVEASSRWGPRWWQAPISLLRPQARELAHFAVSTNLSASLSLVNKDAEPLWISFFRGPLETGYYKLALTLVNLVQMPVAPLPQATYPELSRGVARQDWDAVRDILRQGSLLAGGYTLAAALVLFLVGRPLISLVYTPEFLPAYPALLILLAGFLVANTFYWNRTALLALGKPDFPTRVNLILAIAKLIGILLLVPRFGYLANAALLAGSYVIGVSVCAWKARSILSARRWAADWPG